MCNELTTLMQVVEEPLQRPSDEEVARFMEFMARTIDSQQKVLRLLHERLSRVEVLLETRD